MINWFIFIDEILIYSQDTISYADHLRIVLQTLPEEKLFAKFSKCGFRLNYQVVFLGNIISSKRLKLDSQKIEVVEIWECPKTTSEVRRFLGLVDYYKGFC